MYYRVGFLIKDWIKFREDRSHAGSMSETVLVGMEGGEQIGACHQSEIETMPGFLSIVRESFPGPFVVGRHQEVVAIFVSEVAIQTGEMQLDHVSHRIIGRVLPAE